MTRTVTLPCEEKYTWRPWNIYSATSRAQQISRSCSDLLYEVRICKPSVMIGLGVMPILPANIWNSTSTKSGFYLFWIYNSFLVCLWGHPSFLGYINSQFGWLVLDAKPLVCRRLGTNFFEILQSRGARKGNHVALPFMEAEYIATRSTAQEIVWRRRLLTDLMVPCLGSHLFARRWSSVMHIFCSRTQVFYRNTKPIHKDT